MPYATSKQHTLQNSELREEHRLSVFQNRMLRIFGPKRNEVIGDWRKMHNEELHNLYSSPSIIRMIKTRRMRWREHAARMEQKINAYRIQMEKRDGRIPLGRPRRRWKENIKTGLGKIQWGGMNWIHLAQDRDQWRAFVNTVMNLRVP
jgi:hypothetical protein